MADQLNQKQRFNIDNFKSSLTSKGYQKTTDFNLMIDSLPEGLASAATNSGFKETLDDLLTVRVEMTTLPGVSLATNEIRRYGVGALEMKPYVSVFAPHDVTILGDSSGKIHDFFQSWLNLIVNFNSSTALKDTDTTNNNAGIIQSNKYWYEVSYKESYQTNLTFVSYDRQGEESIKVHLMQAYPIFLAPVAMSWNSTNNLVRFPISFAYYDWWTEKNERGGSGSIPNNSYVGPAQLPAQNLSPDGS